MFQINFRAAFERVSKLQVQRVDKDSFIDIRNISLLPVPPENNYDPREERNPRAEVKPWMAHLNLIRALCGPGLLGMPVAFSGSGLIVGSLFTILSGALLIHMYNLLLNNLAEISRQLKIPYIPYRYGFRAAVLHGPPIFKVFGNNGPMIIAIFMILSQVGICTVCVLLTSDSLRDIADWQSNNSALLVLLPCYLLLEFSMKNFQRLTYVGILGFTLNMTGLSLIFYLIFDEPQRELIYWVPDVGGWLFTWGMCLFNLSALGVILSLDRSLRKPKIMTSTFGVLNVSLGLPIILSLLVGALGYWSFGTMEENVLRSLPLSEPISVIVMSLYVISVTLSYPLHCYPITMVIEEMCIYGTGDYVPTKETMEIIKAFCRPFFVILAFIIAYLFPFQGPVVAFVGSMCTCMLSIVFPIMMDLSLRYGVPRGWGYAYGYLIKDVIIFVFGLITWLMGIYFCGYLIYVRMSERRAKVTDIL